MKLWHLALLYVAWRVLSEKVTPAASRPADPAPGSSAGFTLWEPPPPTLRTFRAVG